MLDSYASRIATFTFYYIWPDFKYYNQQIYSIQHMNNSVTIFTEPSLSLAFRLKKAIRQAVKKHVLRKSTAYFAGHYAVVRSLEAGLNSIGEKYSFNPTSRSELADSVHILAGTDTLKMAIKLKRQGKIKHLTAGPNIVISSADANGIVASPEIDAFFVNSEWTKSAYLLDNPKLEGRLKIWPAGINLSDWKTEKQPTSKPVAVFYKKRAEHFVYEACRTIALQAGYEIAEIIYGSYKPQDLKIKLSVAAVAVYFVEQESQGIALQEIWATNTPTFVWNPKIWMYKGINYACSSAPYLTDKTGAFFRDESEFERLIKQPLAGYEPEKWVREHMTDELCARDFMRQVKETAS